MSKMHIGMRAGESIRIGDTVVTIGERRGSTVRLVIDAPATVKIINPSQLRRAADIEEGAAHHGKHAI